MATKRSPVKGPKKKVAKKTEEPKKQRRSSGLKYTEQEWALLKSYYESGSFASFRLLHQACSKVMKVCPSLSAIKKRGVRDKWGKAVNKEKIQHAYENFTVEMFAKQGLPPGDVIKKVVEGVAAGDKGFIKIYNEMAGALAPSKKAVDITSSDGSAGIQTLIMLPSNGTEKPAPCPSK